MHCPLLLLLTSKQAAFSVWLQVKTVQPCGLRGLSCLPIAFPWHRACTSLRDSALFLWPSVFLCAFGSLDFLNRILYILSLINLLLGTVTIWGFQAPGWDFCGLPSELPLWGTHHLVFSCYWLWQERWKIKNPNHIWLISIHDTKFFLIPTLFSCRDMDWLEEEIGGWEKQPGHI